MAWLVIAWVRPRGGRHLGRKLKRIFRDAPYRVAMGWLTLWMAIAIPVVCHYEPVSAFDARAFAHHRLPVGRPEVQLPVVHGLAADQSDGATWLSTNGRSRFGPLGPDHQIRSGLPNLVEMALGASIGALPANVPVWPLVLELSLLILVLLAFRPGLRRPLDPPPRLLPGLSW